MIGNEGGDVGHGEDDNDRLCERRGRGKGTWTQ
jgi:hypothetical protein